MKLHLLMAALLVLTLIGPLNRQACIAAVLANVTGDWEWAGASSSGYTGTMTLTQSGNRFTGTWMTNGQTYMNQVDGRIEGNKLYLKRSWSGSQDGSPPGEQNYILSPFEGANRFQGFGEGTGISHAPLNLHRLPVPVAVPAPAPTVPAQPGLLGITLGPSVANQQLIFQVGPLEAARISVSADGINWQDIGVYDTLSAQSVDLRNKTRSAKYVKVTILPNIHLSLKDSVLFDFNEAVIKDTATPVLHDVAEHIRANPGCKLVFDGNTDNVGASDYNYKLSLSRAEAVRDYLATNEGISGITTAVRAFGETRPIASNSTEEGREKNRRVDVLILPTTSTSSLTIEAGE